MPCFAIMVTIHPLTVLRKTYLGNTPILHYIVLLLDYCSSLHITLYSVDPYDEKNTEYKIVRLV
jgi:hypothetical protein